MCLQCHNRLVSGDVNISDLIILCVNMYTYFVSSSTPLPLSLSLSLLSQKGDVVTVQRMSVGEGWWEGELRGKRGLFPSSFVKLVSFFTATHNSSRFNDVTIVILFS